MPIPTPNIAHNAEIVGDTLHNISLNYKWRVIVGGQLSRLLHREYWTGTELEIDTALNQLHDLIHDLYTSEVPPMAEYHQATRASTQAIAANTDTKVIFNVGATPPNDWNVPVPTSGICTVAAKVTLLSAVAGAKRATLLYNDAEIASVYPASTGLSQSFNLAQVLEVTEGGYFSLQVRCTTASTVEISPAVPSISMVVVP